MDDLDDLVHAHSQMSWWNMYLQLYDAYVKGSQLLNHRFVSGSQPEGIAYYSMESKLDPDDHLMGSDVDEMVPLYFLQPWKYGLVSSTQLTASLSDDSLSVHFLAKETNYPGYYELHWNKERGEIPEELKIWMDDVKKTCLSNVKVAQQASEKTSATPAMTDNVKSNDPLYTNFGYGKYKAHDQVTCIKVEGGQTDVENYLVPVAHALAKHSTTHWRLSYSSHELRHIQCLASNDDRKAMILCKLLLNYWKKKEFLSPAVKSYYLKTIFMRKLEDPEWKKSKLEDKVLQLLKGLQNAYHTGKLPHFFLPHNNLISHLNTPDLVSTRYELEHLHINLRDEVKTCKDTYHAPTVKRFALYGTISLYILVTVVLSGYIALHSSTTFNTFYVLLQVYSLLRKTYKRYKTEFLLWPVSMFTLTLLMVIAIQSYVYSNLFKPSITFYAFCLILTLRTTGILYYHKKTCRGVYVSTSLRLQYGLGIIYLSRYAFSGLSSASVLISLAIVILTLKSNDFLKALISTIMYLAIFAQNWQEPSNFGNLMIVLPSLAIYFSISCNGFYYCFHYMYQSYPELSRLIRFSVPLICAVFVACVCIFSTGLDDLTLVAIVLAIRWGYLHVWLCEH